MKKTDPARPAFRVSAPCEQPAREAQALCQLLLDQLPVGVFHKDREGRYVFVNSWFCRLHGFRADEFLGKTAQEMAAGRRAPGDAEHPDPLTKAKLFHEGATHHEIIMRTGQPIEAEEHHTDAEGKKRCLHAMTGPLFGNDGTIIGSQGVLLDITERKRAEDELASERDLLRALLNSSTDAIYFKDRQSRFLRCSASMAPLFNLSRPDELIGKSDFDFFGEEHARKAFEDEQEIIRTGQPVIGITEKETWPDGHVTWALTSKMPFCDSHGQIIGTLGISKNITAFKEAEEALRSQQERTRLIIDQAFDAVITTDVDFKIIGWNRQAEKTLGWTQEEILGRFLVDTVVPPGRREVRRQDLERFKATGEWADLNRPVQTTAMHRDGRELPVELTMTPIRVGENFLFTIFIRDIAERTQAEAALAREQYLLESLLENSLDSIYFKDRDSRFLRCSKSLSEKMPGGAADLIGKTDFDLWAEEHARPAFADEQEIIRTGRPIIGKVEKEVAKDGRESWALTSKMPLRNKAGEIVGTFGISKNITAMKQAEAELERTHKQLVQASRLAGMAEVATSVLHNVGNVLNSVNVSAELLLDNAKISRVSSLARAVALLNEHAGDVGAYLAGDPKGRQFPAYLSLLSEQLTKEQQQTVAELELVRENIEHVKEIVAMQQNYASVSGVTETVKATEIVEDALRMNAAALARHDIALVRDYTDEPVLSIDKHKVLQVLVNLIRNAKYACDESGRKDKQIRLQVSKREQWINIVVVDNGVGIPPENLTRIFNHGFTTRKEGHGFGLHSGALAAQELGGYLAASSKGCGLGAVFTLKLPSQPPTAKKTRVLPAALPR